MLAWLGSKIVSVFGGKVIDGLVSGYKAKLDAGNNSERIAADLAGRELQVQQREIEVSGQLRIAQVGHWWEPEHLFAYIVVIYFAKIVIWDVVLGSLTGGSTDPLRGPIAEWAGLIMMFLFGKRGIENVARILKR